jgi:hypothetical protein
MPNIVIDVAAEFTGKKAFDKAGKSASGLESAIGSLGKKLAIAFSAKAVLDFGKAAVKAFAEDEKSAKILTNTMKNLGLEFQNPAVEQFIAKLSAATGEVDDNLRPAMQKLLQVTGSVSKSQELLKLALDVSAGSGVSLETVVSDLTAAQSGNTKGLKKYALGLTAAQLKTIKFEDVTDKLAKTFAGSASTAAQTFTGQMKILTTAAGEAQETIGKGLVDAFKILSGTNTGIEPITKAMADLSQEVSDTIVGLALFIKKIKEIPIAGKGFSLILDNYVNILKQLRPELRLLIDAQQALSDMAKRQTAPFQLGMSVTGATDFGKAAEIAAKKAEEAAKKAAAAKAKADKLAAAAKIKADKNAADNAAKLAKAGAMFDIEKIQIEAALKGRISADEKLRLELQRAILNEDFELADKLQKRLEASQRATAALQGTLAAIKPVPSPFDEWINALKEIGDTLSKILGINVNTSSSMLNPNQPIVATQTPNSPFQEGTTPLTVTTVADLADAATTAAEMATLAANEAAALAADAGTFASTFAAGAAAAGAAGAALITGNNPHPILPYTGSSSSIFNPYGLSSNVAGWGTNISTVQDMPAMPPIVVNIEGLIDMDNVEGVFNQAMLNAIRKGLPQTIAGALP